MPAIQAGYFDIAAANSSGSSAYQNASNDSPNNSFAGAKPFFGSVNLVGLTLGASYFFIAHSFAIFLVTLLFFGK
jgi:hypothetical protein